MSLRHALPVRPALRLPLLLVAAGCVALPACRSDGDAPTTQSTTQSTTRPTAPPATQPAMQPSGGDGSMSGRMDPVDTRVARPAMTGGAGGEMSGELSPVASELRTVIINKIQAGGWVVGTNSTQDLDAQLMVAAERMGPNPDKKAMKRAKENAGKLADAILAEAEGTRAPRITRTLLASAVAKTSPLWPFTEEEVPPIVPGTRGAPIAPMQR